MHRGFVFPGVCLCLCLFLPVSDACLAGPATPAGALRYFLQPPDLAGSRTPYGNNAAAAHSVRSGDAHIYYEVYGEGSPVFVFHGGAWAVPTSSAPSSTGFAGTIRWWSFPPGDTAVRKSATAP